MITAENTQNMPEIEMQWAVKAMTHAETYWGILQQRPGSSLKLTKIDDEIYTTFRNVFPDLNIEHLKETEDFKNEKAKAKWRGYIKQFENRVNDFSFGTLIRINSHEGYSEENSMFLTRIQFLCIEIARSKEGFNDEFFSKN
ncbi:hypothetical protein BB559_002357 [Furculomyces boomerangus]|uniref:Polysaccharide biosynthesis domain-containing protein n=1 Tax=Furculomyces boomerangus TaxID=61424 RepID=A0A2T9YVY9_9FUNG|nr:hypothetical protein BB559_002357 [Furculomyces boomerangus]